MTPILVGIIVVLLFVVVYLIRANRLNYNLAVRYMALHEALAGLCPAPEPACLCCENGVQVLGPDDFMLNTVVRNGHVYKK